MKIINLNNVRCLTHRCFMHGHAISPKERRHIKHLLATVRPRIGWGGEGALPTYPTRIISVCLKLKSMSFLMLCFKLET